jgi:hypothetical protein
LKTLLPATLRHKAGRVTKRSGSGHRRRMAVNVKFLGGLDIPLTGDLWFRIGF